MLYDDIVDFDNLLAAYREARKGKRYRGEVAGYTARLEEKLLNLHNHLVWQTWEPSRAREFVVLEPKMRRIQAPPFPDRIVHHALVDLVEPMFERRFIDHSYACRKGKGTHAAILSLQKMLRQCRRNWGTVYVVQADVSQFFASVNHDAVMAQAERVIDCDRTLNLWRTILGAYGHEDGIGLPVGALTSQLSANIVLDRVDHAMTDNKGAGRYLRYMDDIVILAPSKQQAHKRLNQLAGEIAYSGLKLNPKTCIKPASAGVDWCGYRTWSTHILPRKRNVKRFKRDMQRASRKFSRGQATVADFRQKVNSYLAYAKHCNAWDTTNSILNNLTLRRDDENH
ncbi:MAG: phage-encoded reverse transcriptase [Marinobacter sp. T13-3]|nr:MAG: phage-encoded reverse transcriptase [Marinobacter sp. T13-3]